MGFLVSFVWFSVVLLLSSPSPGFPSPPARRGISVPIVPVPSPLLLLLLQTRHRNRHEERRADSRLTRIHRPRSPPVPLAFTPAAPSTHPFFFQLSSASAPSSSPSTRPSPASAKPTSASAPRTTPRAAAW